MSDNEIFKKIVERTIVDFENSTISKITDRSFAGCSLLTNFNTPNVTSIGEGGLMGCTSLTALTFPRLVSAGSWAFNGCNNLVKLDLGESFSNMGSFALQNCTKLRYYILRRTTVAYYALDSRMWSGTLIYVPDNLVEEYKASSTWKNYASRIKAISELPEGI